MSMQISNNYSGYASTAYSGKKTAENTAAQKTAESENASGKTAADELAYLTKKYDGYSFIGANYTYGLQYGSKSTTNVAISPQFLAKMANDPELEAEYEKQIAGMRELDEQFRQMQAARGWRVDAQGWAIDKDGGISSWTIVTRDENTKSYLQDMAESTEKTREQAAENRKEKAELEKQREEDRKAQKLLQEKIEEAGKKRFGDKFKGAVAVEKGSDLFEKFRIMAQKLASGEFQVPPKDGAGGLDTKA